MHGRLSCFNALLALALLAVSSIVAAQVTISHVRVTISGAGGSQSFCDVGTTCDAQIWSNFPVALQPGQRLLLAQTGPIFDGQGNVIGGNFDTSDRGALLKPCAASDPCTTTIEVDTGSGLTQVYTSGADELTAFNLEPEAAGPSPTFNEAAKFSTVVTKPTWSLAIGYADDEHTDPCLGGVIGNLCFPSLAFPTFAEFFRARGLTVEEMKTDPSACGSGTRDTVDFHDFGSDGGCYDSGALLFTAFQAAPQGCTPGYWKNHTAAWVGTGYSTGQLVSDVFSGVDSSLAGATLLDALSFQGGSTLAGKEQILLRAAVSALLNAGKGLNYPLTTTQVINQVNAAIATGNKTTITNLATVLDGYNNAGTCPLN